MSIKTELREASLELQAALDKIGAISEELPSLMVYNKDTDGKASYGESFAAIYEINAKRIDYFRRQLSKIENLIPKPKKTGNIDLVKPAAKNSDGLIKKVRKPRSDAGKKRK